MSGMKRTVKGRPNGEGIYDGLISEKKDHFKKLIKASYPTYASP